jgi:uncharacterized membrane protein
MGRKLFLVGTLIAVALLAITPAWAPPRKDWPYKHHMTHPLDELIEFLIILNALQLLVIIIWLYSDYSESQRKGQVQAKNQAQAKEVKCQHRV